MASNHNLLGIDIGGSGIKGAPVDLSTGAFTAERVRIPTPKKATPKNCAAVINEIIGSFPELGADAPIGITVPGPVRHGVVMMMANMHSDWIGLPVNEYFSDKLGRQFSFVNDADAAGIAEARYGAATDVPGLVIVTTLGTGIGSAFVHNGVLIPNAELGHIELKGHDAETRASSAAKTNFRLSYKRWAKRLQRYYRYLERLFWPDLFVVGGGISKDHQKFLPLIELSTPIVPAQLLNQAGIVGAAVVAAESCGYQG